MARIRNIRYNWYIAAATEFEKISFFCFICSQKYELYQIAEITEIYNEYENPIKIKTNQIGFLCV